MDIGTDDVLAVYDVRSQRPNHGGAFLQDKLAASCNSTQIYLDIQSANYRSGSSLYFADNFICFIDEKIRKDNAVTLTGPYTKT